MYVCVSVCVCVCVCLIPAPSADLFEFLDEDKDGLLSRKNFLQLSVGAEEEEVANIVAAQRIAEDALRELLLSTGDARLVECGRVDTPVNREWGEVNGRGRNMLGVLLMAVRAELC